ncbi:MAG: hypothetical protein ABSA30_11190 [Candidatus Aminicenantales bacterium]
MRIRPGAGDSVRALLEIASPLLRPRALFRDAFIGRREDAAVEIGGRLFHSRVLARNLEGTDLVFPFVLTVGGDLEKEASAQGDLLRQYYLEAIADLALSAAAGRLGDHLRNIFGLKKLGQMDPGSLEDWPLDQQVPLFALLGDTQGRLGVRLTDSLLMIPRKSISGIFFPSEESFTSCRLCPRPNCQGRRTTYDPGLRRAYGLEDGDP